MRVFPTGVTILLTDAGDGARGMTANAVTSISLDPPLVMVSLAHTSKMNAALGDGTSFSINVLDAQQAPLADRFAGRWSWAPDSGELDSLETVPTVPNSLASLACRVESRVVAGDHTMVIGRVVAARQREGMPLIFYDGRWTSFPSPDDVFLLDRTPFRAELQRALVVDAESTALVAIDMTRGHLDPTIATMPLPPEAASSVVRRARAILDAVRAHGCPIIHVTLQFTPEDIARNPFCRAVDAASTGLIPWRKTLISEHNPRGSVQATIVDELAPVPGEFVIDDKHRPSAFFETRLEPLLTELAVETVVFVGVNTNTSILHSAFDAFCRDLQVVVLSDCTISMYGNDLHELALKNIQYTIGWVLTSEELLHRLGRNAALPT